MDSGINNWQTLISYVCGLASTRLPQLGVLYKVVNEPPRFTKTFQFPSAMKGSQMLEHMANFIESSNYGQYFI